MFWVSQLPKHSIAIAILLVGTWLRVPLLFTEGMHADEALFGTWANWIASGWDVLLQNQVVDKPPVLFYVQAIALQLFTRADFALRVPNFVASLGLIALALTPGDRLFFLHRQESILFALLLTLSPFLIQFSGTGFTDPLMLYFGVAGLLVMQRDRFGWSGILFGLAIATKYTAIFLLPLLIIFINPAISQRREFALFMQGLCGVLFCLICWLILSGNGLGGTGDGQLIRGLRVVSSAELLPRLQIWNTHLYAAFGYPFFIIMLPAASFLHWYGSNRDRLLIAYTTGYFAFHWLIATALHDRYMLPLVWMSCWIAARSIRLLFRKASQNSSQAVIYVAITTLLVPLILAPAALSARRDGYTADRLDIAPLTEPFADAPYGTVLYDHFYSWHLRYELFYERVYVEWVPHPAELIENLAVFYDEQRYLVLPDAAVATRFHVALNENGYTLQRLVQSGDVILYKIER